MKNKIVIVIFVSLLGFTACSDDSGREPQPVRATAVRLEGAIGLSTRAVIGSGYNEDLKVCFARRDVLTPGLPDVTGSWGVHSAVRSGGVGSRPIVFMETQTYPASGSVYLHGYYPTDGGKAVPDLAAGKVTFTIDGQTDVMATGYFKASSDQASVPCTFCHLLTWLSFVCYSDESGKWGKIVKIEAADIPLQQEMDWTSVSGEVKLRVAAGSPAGTLPVQDIAYPLPLLQVSQDDPLPGEDKATGYILLPVAGVAGNLGTPVNALWLNITTTKDGKGVETETTFRVSVSVEGGLQAGSRHILSLFFTDGIGIEVARVGVTPWEDAAITNPNIPMQ